MMRKAKHYHRYVDIVLTEDADMCQWYFGYKNGMYCLWDGIPDFIDHRSNLIDAFCIPDMERRFNNIKNLRHHDSVWFMGVEDIIFTKPKDVSDDKKIERRS